MKAVLKCSIVKQLACFLLAVMITAAFVPLPARASTVKYNYKSTTLKQKKWVTAKESTYIYNQDKDIVTHNYYLYKISIPANSFIRIDSKTKTGIFYLYKSLNRTKSPYDQDNCIHLYNDKIYRYVLPKGTYYIHAFETTFKWQCTTTKNPTNFCRARSIRLKAGYKKTEVFNHGYEFDRWYRLSLSARKPITVTMKKLDSGYSEFSLLIYDSRGNKVTCNELNYPNYRTAVLSKGTYYILICNDFPFDRDSGGIAQFWWR